MMKLEFQRTNDMSSISQFEPIDIADFTILTGINGSGKTHVLEAIKRGDVLIKGISHDDVQYFSYSTFVVSTSVENEKYRPWHEDEWASLGQAQSEGLSTKGELRENYPHLYEMLRHVSDDRNLSSLTKGDFEPLDLLLQDITKAERQYWIAKVKNNLKEKGGLPGELATIGENPPSVLLNEVLVEYDCNGYRLITNQNYPLQETDEGVKVDVKIQMVLTRDGTKVDFPQLSSGEKTLMALSLLIFKAAQGKITPRVLLLDEIDASLHPSMIERMLDVIQKLFVAKYRMKVILATHSPTTVALGPKESIFVISNEDRQTNIIQQSQQAAVETLAKGYITLNRGLELLNQITFNKLNIFSEGNNVNYIKKAIELLAPELSKDIYIVEGIEDRSGKEQLWKIYDLFFKVKHDDNVLFVFDCDQGNSSRRESNDTFGSLIRKASAKHAGYSDFLSWRYAFFPLRYFLTVALPHRSLRSW